MRGTISQRTQERIQAHHRALFSFRLWFLGTSQEYTSNKHRSRADYSGYSASPFPHRRQQGLERIDKYFSVINGVNIQEMICSQFNKWTIVRSMVELTAPGIKLISRDGDFQTATVLDRLYRVSQESLEASAFRRRRSTCFRRSISN